MKICFCCGDEKRYSGSEEEFDKCSCYLGGCSNCFDLQEEEDVEEQEIEEVCSKCNWKGFLHT